MTAHHDHTAPAVPKPSVWPFAAGDPARFAVADRVRHRIDQAGMAALLAMRDTSYNCVICRDETAFSPDNPASVIAISDGTSHLCSFAHPSCSPSRLITTPKPLDTMMQGRSPEVEVSTNLLHRAAGCQPRAALVCRPALHSRRVNPEPGAPVHFIAAALVEHGFILLTELGEPFPALPALHARITGDQLDITAPVMLNAARHRHLPANQRDDIATLITCTLPTLDDETHSWCESALATGLLGVVVLAGANPDPTTDPREELTAAIHEGRAVAATVRLSAEAARSLADHAARLPHDTTTRQPTTDRPEHPNHWARPDDDRPERVA